MTPTVKKIAPTNLLRIFVFAMITNVTKPASLNHWLIDRWGVSTFERPIFTLTLQIDIMNTSSEIVVMWMSQNPFILSQHLVR